MQKTKRFGLVLTQSEKIVVSLLAEHEGGLSQAALIRRLIRKAAHERGLWPPKLRKKIRQYKMIDDNPQAELLARIYSAILAWGDPPDKKETADRNEFGDQVRSAADATEPDGSARLNSNME